jgi:hypothetical protein
MVKSFSELFFVRDREDKIWFYPYNYFSRKGYHVESVAKKAKIQNTYFWGEMIIFLILTPLLITLTIFLKSQNDLFPASFLCLIFICGFYLIGKVIINKNFTLQPFTTAHIPTFNWAPLWFLN